VIEDSAIEKLIERAKDDGTEISMLSLENMKNFFNKYKLTNKPMLFAKHNGNVEVLIGNVFLLQFTENKILSRVFFQDYHENVLTSFLLRHNLTHFFEGDVIASLAQRERVPLTQERS
jgi:hypothetical protein